GGVDRVDDRRHPEPEEQKDLEQVLDVAQVHVGGGQKQAHRRHEHHEDHERDRQEKQVGAEEVEAEHQKGAEEHDQLQDEVHKAGADGGQGEDLAREVDLLDQPPVAGDRDRGCPQGGAEEVPSHQAGEEVEGEVGDARLQELPEDDPVDHQEEQGPGQRPQEAEGRVLVLDLQLLAYEVHQQLAELPDLPDGGAEPEEERLRFVDADEGLVGLRAQGALQGSWARDRVKNNPPP